MHTYIPSSILFVHAETQETSVLTRVWRTREIKNKKPKETARASRKGRKSMSLLPRQGRAGLQDGPSHVSLYHLLHRDRVLCK